MKKEKKVDDDYYYDPHMQTELSTHWDQNGTYNLRKSARFIIFFPDDNNQDQKDDILNLRFT